jgi:HD-GYP domain-containing protein (c-di-GMP phosphodiesterase class II)
MAAHDQVTLNLAGLRRVDNYTFMHSLSVAVLSVAAGMELGLSEDQLLELSFAGALHDIGKMRIPLAVLNKPGKLDAEEWQLMKRHPRLGMELLTNHGGVATAALQGIYEHHERMDGSGYPHRLPGKQISLFGRIVAVADVYDAMTSDRVYRAGMAPHLAVEQLIGESLTRFDWPIVSAFIRSLVVYPVGSLVVMDNGEVGRVISYRRTVPYRPKVAIIADAYGRRVFPPRECDMLKELTRFVTEVRKK